MKIGVYFFIEKIGRRFGEMASLVSTGVCLFINLFVPKGYYFFYILYISHRITMPFLFLTFQFFPRLSQFATQISGLLVLLWQFLGRLCQNPHSQSSSSTQLSSFQRLYGQSLIISEAGLTTCTNESVKMNLIAQLFLSLSLPFRQNGIGFTSFLARLGVSISPLIMLLEDVWNLLPSVIYCVVAVGCGLVSMLLPETLHTRLPETIEDIEKPGKRRSLSEENCS